MTEPIRRAIGAVAGRHKWNADALYAVVSLCTGGTFACDAGAEQWTPKSTAIGLFRFTEGTARRFGIEASPHPPAKLGLYEGLKSHFAADGPERWATWTLASMTAADQVDLLERYLVSAFERRAPRRPVDYYLAALGASPGLDDSTRVGNTLTTTPDGRTLYGRTVGELRRELEAEIVKHRRANSTGMGDVLWSLLVMVLVRRAVL